MGEIQIALQPITGNGSQMASWCSAINPKNHATGAVAWGAVARPLRDPARGLTAVRSSDACQPPTAVPCLP